MNTKMKERLTQATALAKEMFGEEVLTQNPGIINAILMSMALDEFKDSINQENEKLTDCIFRAAGHIAE